MNLTDLRDELTSHADDLGTPPDLAAGVAARVRTTRRRRAVAAGSVATLAVAALAVAVVTSLGRPAPTVPAASASSAAPMIGADGMPFRSVPDAPGDVVKDGLRYRAEVADDTLVAGFIADRGQGQFSLLWDPTTTHVSVGAECWLPGMTSAEAAKYLVTVSLGGAEGFFGSSCSAGRPAERDLPAGGTVPGEPGRGWSELTVGRAASVRVQLVDAATNKPASVDGAQLTGAVYELGSEQPVTDASGRTVAVLPDIIEHQGYPYELKGMVAAPLTSWQDSTQGLPAGPALVTWGSAGDDFIKDGSLAGSGMRISGLWSGTEELSYGGRSTSVVPADSTPRFTVSAEGKRPVRGTGFVAVYGLDTAAVQATPLPSR